jgi:hypothetical protein
MRPFTLLPESELPHRVDSELDKIGNIRPKPDID